MRRRHAGRRAGRSVLLAALLVLGPHLATASPLTKPEVLKLVRKHVQERRLLAVVKELGIDFKITPDVVGELRTAGASASLIASLREIAAADGDEVASTPAVPPAVSTSSPTPAPPAAPPAPPTAPEPGGQELTEPALERARPPSEPAVVEEAARPPASPLPRAAIDTMAALIPGPPPPPPPPVSVTAIGSPPPEPSAVPAAPAAPAVPASPPPEPAAAEATGKWEQVRPLLERAQALAAEGDVRGAQMLVVKAMELDPVEPQVWKTFKGIEQDLLARAETFLADGQLPRALREFQFVITTNPESALGYNGVGLALLQLKNYDEAVAAFEHALALEPGNARYRQALTRARSLQRASKALERQGQQNLREMIEDQSGKKKGP